nr:hypothetical protein [Chamaesiphon sp. OTE_8_metabat_110]
MQRSPEKSCNNAIDAGTTVGVRMVENANPAAIAIPSPRSNADRCQGKIASGTMPKMLVPTDIKIDRNRSRVAL